MTQLPVQEAPTLRQDEPVAEAVRTLLASGLPALPVVGSEGLLVGLFGEREFMAALFPGYVGELHYAAFVSGQLDEALEKRAACAREPVAQHMNTDHVSVDEDFSDVGLAEVFLHHRVLACRSSVTSARWASSDARRSSDTSPSASLSAPRRSENK
jgi:CBS domain-containing protein